MVADEMLFSPRILLIQRGKRTKQAVEVDKREKAEKLINVNK